MEVQRADGVLVWEPNQAQQPVRTAAGAAGAEPGVQGWEGGG